MGFGAFLAGAATAIVSFVSNAAAFIGGAVAKIGVASGGFAGKFLGLVSKMPSIDKIATIIQVVDLVAKVINTIVDFLGIKTEEDPEVLGAKAEQAEKGIDDFDGDVEAYIRYLHEEIELDKEKFNQMSPEEKMGCKAVGITLESKAIEQKLGGVEITPESLVLLGKLQLDENVKISAKDIVDTILGLKSEGITNMNDVVDYLEGKGDSDRIKTGTALKSVIGENAEDKIDVLKEAVRKYEDLE